MNPAVAVTSEQFLRRGLRLVKVNCNRLGRAAKIRKFRSFFGPHPNHCVSMWNDLFTTNIAAARVNIEDADLVGFFAALNFLRAYDKEDRRAALFEMNEKTLRELTWWWVRKLAALKPLRVVWPANWDTVFTISVDGMHRCVQEVWDELVRRNSKWFSHKYNKAGVNHEIALHLFESRVVHCKRWDVASKHDKTIFKEELHHKIPAGKRVIADQGYNGLPEVYSTRNQFDTERVKAFKRRAKSRQEAFNSKLMVYQAVSDRFRHKVVPQPHHRLQEEKQELCFDAVLVLCCYAIEDTDPESTEALFAI